MFIGISGILMIIILTLIMLVLLTTFSFFLFTFLYSNNNGSLSLVIISGFFSLITMIGNMFLISYYIKQNNDFIKSEYHAVEKFIPYNQISQLVSLGRDENFSYYYDIKVLTKKGTIENFLFEPYENKIIMVNHF